MTPPREDTIARVVGGIVVVVVVGVGVVVDVGGCCREVSMGGCVVVVVVAEWSRHGHRSQITNFTNADKTVTSKK